MSDAILPAPVAVAGLRKRLFAWLIDSVVLFIVGWSLGLLFLEELAALGGWEPLIGFVIAVGYTGAANSRDFGGRTIGKTILKIRVLGLDGSPLSVPRSMLRSSVLWTPMVLNGLVLPGIMASPWVQSLLTVLVVGSGLAIVYLFLFNVPTRRSLHDLVADSCVVEQGSDAASRHELRQRHLVAIGSLFCLAAVLPFLTGQGAAVDSARAMWTVAASADLGTGVTISGVTVGAQMQAFIGQGSSTQRSITVRARVTDREVNLERIADEVVRSVIVQVPQASDTDILSVVFTYGFNLGIASRWQNQFMSGSPADWRTRLALP